MPQNYDAYFPIIEILPDDAWVDLTIENPKAKKKIQSYKIRGSKLKEQILAGVPEPDLKVKTVKATLDPATLRATSEIPGNKIALVPAQEGIFYQAVAGAAFLDWESEAYEAIELQIGNDGATDAMLFIPNSDLMSRATDTRLPFTNRNSSDNSMLVNDPLCVYLKDSSLTGNSMGAVY